MRVVLSVLLFLGCLNACSAASNAPASTDAVTREPVIGGPCEGCENIFIGRPDRPQSSARIAPKNEKGEALVLDGTVRDAAGAPRSGITVYAYQTDASGRYPKSNTRHGRLRAWVSTDANGRYRFDTIRPGAYPSRDNPQHIHMHILEPGKATYTIDDITFDDDPLLTAAHRQRTNEGRGGTGISVPTRDARGVWHVRRDITLGLRIEGYDR